MKIVLIVSLTFSFLSLVAKPDLSLDSVRVETKNGKKFVIHQVEPKETLFAISRRYQVSVDAITNENPSTLKGISIGQELTIPLVSINNSIINSPEQISHFVDIGETLYSISKKYAVSVDDLKVWNNLSSNELNVGQQLKVNLTAIDERTPLLVLKESTEASILDTSNKYHIVEEQQTLFGISQKYDVSIKQLQIWNELNSTNISIGQPLIVGKKAEETIIADAVVIIKPVIEPEEEIDTASKAVIVVEVPEEIPIDADDVPEFNSRTVKEGSLEKVFEEGMAMVIANTTDTKKYLALHRSADVGTVMKVKNMMNDLAIYVRVVGKLPDTGDNSKVLLKLSRTAYERLGAVDRQFPVEVSYIP